MTNLRTTTRGRQVTILDNISLIIYSLPFIPQNVLSLLLERHIAIRYSSSLNKFLVHDKEILKP
jgi:hypothetical protein